MTYIYPIDAILLIGPTGAGKSPLGDALARYGLFGRRCLHLDFGSELRLTVSDRRYSPAYSQHELDFISGVLKRGRLLENEHSYLTEKIISFFLERSGFLQKDILVLNGVPRHAGQAEDIAKIADIHALIVFDCTVKEVHNRIRYNIGGDRSERNDDSRELIEKKLRIFQERTAPLIELYKKRGCSIFRISVADNMTANKIYQAVASLASADPPITLVTKPPQR